VGAEAIAADRLERRPTGARHRLRRCAARIDCDAKPSEEHLEQIARALGTEGVAR
jgi:hypothetical protein